MEEGVKVALGILAVHEIEEKVCMGRIHMALDNTGITSRVLETSSSNVIGTTALADYVSRMRLLLDENPKSLRTTIALGWGLLSFRRSLVLFDVVIDLLDITNRSIL